eukprot:TRINITY_DN4155_c0_g1_i1.p1 TRINITY_DN4155_c0_g1~~TRINITY_DN4155_c0_g1_i1.p1  ORF type:complete len:639 (-),score=82.38 TRINITY_DN4155_c0_g1_i1:103-1899(-)
MAERAEKKIEEWTNFDSTTTTLEGPSKNPFTIKDYAPQAFKEIRKLFNISTEAYLHSWQIPSTEGSAMSKSTGRSGSNFYMTPDKRFFFKTLLHPEVAAMMEFLPDYVKNFKSNPRSFIMKVYALHRIKHSGNKVWIIVMGNIIPPEVSIDEKYDLKGRVPKKGKDRSGNPSSNDTLKDNEISRSIDFGDIEKEFFRHQLKKDVQLLKKHDIMDYSLLLGIHHVTEEDENRFIKNCKMVKRFLSKEKHTDKNKILTIKTMMQNNSLTAESLINSPEVASLLGIPVEKMSAYEFGGLRGFHPRTKKSEIYFIGIIDCLTRYVAAKIIANTFKSVLWKAETLSTVPAEFYGNRFLNYMTTRLVSSGSKLSYPPTSPKKEVFLTSKRNTVRVTPLPTKTKQGRMTSEGNHSVTNSNSNLHRRKRSESLGSNTTSRTDPDKRPRKHSSGYYRPEHARRSAVVENNYQYPEHRHYEKKKRSNTTTAHLPHSERKNRMSHYRVEVRDPIDDISSTSDSYEVYGKRKRHQEKSWRASEPEEIEISQEDDTYNAKNWSVRHHKANRRSKIPVTDEKERKHRGRHHWENDYEEIYSGHKRGKRRNEK